MIYSLFTRSARICSVAAYMHFYNRTSSRYEFPGSLGTFFTSLSSSSVAIFFASSLTTFLVPQIPRPLFYRYISVSLSFFPWVFIKLQPMYQSMFLPALLFSPAIALSFVYLFARARSFWSTDQPPAQFSFYFSRLRRSSSFFFIESPKAYIYAEVVK